MSRPKSLQSHDFEGQSLPFASIQSENVAYWLYITQHEKYSHTATLCCALYSLQKCFRNILIHVYLFFL